MPTAYLITNNCWVGTYIKLDTHMYFIQDKMLKSGIVLLKKLLNTYNTISGCKDIQGIRGYSSHVCIHNLYPYTDTGRFKLTVISLDHIKIYACV